MESLPEYTNQIKLLEEKVAALEKQLDETKYILGGHLYSIERNMTRQYVEDWTVTDEDGKKGNFCGIMYWIKGEGSIYYNDKTHFEGNWDSAGEIIDGKLFDRNYELLSEWIDGVEVESDEEGSEEAEEEEEEEEEE